MERPCDRECQVLGARADLFDASRRDAPRPCATECAPLARDPTNCRADVSHGRALMRRPDAQTMVTVLGTHFGTQNFERPMSHRVPSLLVCALLCSRSHAAMRRGLVRLSVNPWRAAQRIAAQILAVGTSSREAVMREQ